MSHAGLDRNIGAAWNTGTNDTGVEAVSPRRHYWLPAVPLRREPGGRSKMFHVEHSMLR